MEREDGTSTAAADGDATRMVGATGGTLFGVAPEAKTGRPNDFRRSTNLIAVMLSNVVLSETGVLAFLHTTQSDVNGCIGHEPL